MCGIVGRAAPAPDSAPDLQHACSSLANRGPDGAQSKAWHGAHWSVAFGHTRLAINDLTPAGLQPSSTADGRYAMLFNGEIYNYAELRQRYEAQGHVFTSRMDGEVILHGFAQEGTAVFERLNGIFAIAVLDTLTGGLVLCRDPLGVKPLFYSHGSDGSLVFASELRALRLAGADLQERDLVAEAQFLSFLWVPGPRTPFTGAKALPPGTCMTWSGGDVLTVPYTAPLVPSAEVRTVTADVAIGEGLDLLRAAAGRQLLSDVPVGLMASGGIDSGLLWEATRDDIHTAFTIAWSETGGEGLGEDLTGVRRLQRLYGTDVVELPGAGSELEGLPAAGDLFADPAFALTRHIAAQASERGIKVLLSGQGGDELFAGYRRHQVARVIKSLRLGRLGRSLDAGLQRLPLHSTSVEYASRLSLALAERDPFRGYMQLSTYSTARDRAEALGCTTAEVSDDVVWQEHQAFYDALPSSMSFTRKMMAVDLNVYMPGLGLAYVDRAGMEHGVEIRVPWLDLDLVRWSLDLPLDLLLRQRQGKWLTRQMAVRALPLATAQAPKRGFGAPSSHLERDAGQHSGRGFRQGVYFSRARRLLDEHRTTVGAELLRA